MIIISSTSNLKVKALRQGLREGKPLEPDTIWVEGIKLARETLSTGLFVEEAWVSVEKAERGPLRQLTRELEARSVPMIYVTDHVFESLSELESPQGILLVARRPVIHWDELLTRESFVLVACEIQDPGNLGSLFRSAEAFGVNAVLVSAGSAFPFSPKVIRSSSGAVLRLPIHENQDVLGMLEQLKKQNFQMLAAAGGGNQDFRSVEYGGKLALWVGNEGCGLPDSVLAGTDRRISIPLASPVDSLNVATAASIILCEAARQRGH